MNNDALQIVVTVLGILSQAILLVKQIPKQRLNEEAVSSPEVIKLSEAGQQAYKLLDLSFVLLCSTFFSMLLMDSLVISGRTPSPGLKTILAVLAIAAVVFVVMFGAWRLNQSEKVTGFLALTTLAVLIISPGGPFGASTITTKDVQEGLTLYIPVLFLVTLASTMMIYSFGNPISDIVAQNKRIMVSLAIAILLIIGAGTLGQYLVRKVMRSEKTPKIENDSAKELVREISRWDLQQQQQYYQFAAEIALAYKYQEAYQQLRNVQQQIQPNWEPTPTPQPQSTLKPTASNPIVAASPTPTPRQPTPQQNAPNDKKKLETLLTFAGSNRIDLLVDQFTSMSVKVQEKVLLQRLNWVHPVGQERTQSSLPLTGIKIADRYERIAILRTFQVLYEQPNLRDKLFSEFNSYPPPVVQYYFPSSPGEYERRLGNDDTAFPVVIRAFLPGKKESTYKLSLFPQFGTSDDSLRLKMQLSLPLIAESSITYREYAHLALQIIKNIASDSPDSQHYDAIANDLKKLSGASQNALRYYIASDQSPLDVLQSLVQLSDVDFNPLINGSALAPYALRFNLDAYNKSPLPSMPPADPLKKLAYDIVSKNNKDLMKTIYRLLDKEDSNIQIQPLLEKPVFEFINKIDRSLSKDTKQDFFNAVADPVWVVIKSMARTVAAQHKKEESFFEQSLELFRSQMTDMERDRLLHLLAISLYQPGGEFSLDPIDLLLVQSMAWSESAALICASIIMLPFLIVCIFCSSHFARKLVARNRTREIISRELEGYSESFNTVGNPVELYGRDEVLRNLRSLTERGWSTIGVVGRRGVGKSRILFALSQSNSGKAEEPAVKVWVASPSQFQEEDFITNIFERLAISTEVAIASYLGAKPISIRRIESRTAYVNLWYYAFVMSLLLIVMYQIYDRLTRADIIITWLPIAALLFSSMIFIAYYMFKLQPIDLSSWLQRDRTHNLHTVMLYREANEALRFLRHRSRRIADADGYLQIDNPLRTLFMKVSLGIFFCALVYTVAAIFSDDLGFWEPMIGLFITVASGVSWVLLNPQRGDREARAAMRGQSLMSLIAEYRSFAASIVYQLKQGALGDSAKRKFSVLICVDELDKIVDFEEIRAFVRRVKAIFEVPGVYYYVSLAEDTLTTLYLGMATGKNEIDSSFDHIVRIPPLTCDVGEEIATRYLQLHGIEEPSPRLARTIATLSFGIPRDIIRRCDEYIARGEKVGLKSNQLISELRKLQANFGHELHYLSNMESADLSGDFLKAAMTAHRLLNSGPTYDIEESRQLILSLWLMSLIEAAIDMTDNESWRKISDELCVIGYRLPVETTSDLKLNIEKLHAGILTNDHLNS